MSGSNPGFVLGQVPTPTEWNDYFSGKVDETQLDGQAAQVMAAPAGQAGQAAMIALAGAHIQSAIDQKSIVIDGAGNAAIGAISVTPSVSSSAIIARSLQSIFADVLNVKDFGAIGDGSSHPLSGVDTFNGVDTSGWTLAQWQAIFPFATALSNELSGCAIEAARLQSVSSGLKLYIPAGNYYDNLGHDIGTGALTIIGDPYLSTVTFTGSQGFYSTAAQNTHIEGLTLESTGAVVSLSMVWPTGVGIQAQTVGLVNNRFTGSASTANSLCHLSNIVQSDIVGNKFYYANGNAYGLIVDQESLNINISGNIFAGSASGSPWTTTAVMVNGDASAVGNQGVRFSNNIIIGAGVGLLIENGIDWVTVTNCMIDQCITPMSAVSSASIVNVSGTYFGAIYTATAGGVVSVSSAACNFARCQFVAYASGSTSSALSGVDFNSGSGNVNVTGCSFNGTVTAFLNEGTVYFQRYGNNGDSNNTLLGPLTTSGIFTAQAGINVNGGDANVNGSANNVGISGSATGIPVGITAFGTDTNIGVNITPKGTGAAAVIGSANNIGLAGAAAGSPVTVTATGTDTNIGVNIVTKGSGVLTVNGSPVGGGGGSAGSSYNVATPANGNSITIATSTDLFYTQQINPTNTVTSLTITLPTSPPDAQRLTIASNASMSGIVITPNTSQTLGPNIPTAIKQGTGFTLQIQAGVWERVQ